MEYKAKLDEAMRRKRMYGYNRLKVYDLLWEKCAKATQNKITSRLDYNSSVYNNPIVLLRAIKDHLLNYQGMRYEMAIISDDFWSTFTSLQKDREILQDYTRKFNSSTEIVKYHLGGPLILEKYIKTM